MTKILEQIDEDAHDAIKWLAAEYKYLEEFKKDLEKAKGDINNIRKGKKDVKTAERLLRLIGNCERRAATYEERLDKDLQQLLKMLPENLKEECANIEQNLRVAMGNILKNTSRYVGDLRGEIDKLKLQFDLLKRNPNDQLCQKRIENIINKLEPQVSDMIQWISSLSVDLKEAQKFEERLAA